MDKTGNLRGLMGLCGFGLYVRAAGSHVGLQGVTRPSSPLPGPQEESSFHFKLPGGGGVSSRARPGKADKEAPEPPLLPLCNRKT